MHNQPGTRRWLAQLLVASLVLGLLGGRHPLKVQAQGSQAAQAATVHTDGRSKPEGMHFAWQTPGDSEAPTAAALTLALAQLTPVQYGGYRLPMGLQTVILADDVAVTVQLDRVIAQPWQTPSPAEPVTPALLDREPDQPAEPETLTLPAEPLFVLREGRVRGQRVGGIALYPLY